MCRKSLYGGKENLKDDNTQCWWGIARKRNNSTATSPFFKISLSSWDGSLWFEYYSSKTLFQNEAILEAKLCGDNSDWSICTNDCQRKSNC